MIRRLTQTLPLLLLLWGGSGSFALVRAQLGPAQVFNTADSPLPDNTVGALCYDARRTRLWVGTDFGLAALDLSVPTAPGWTVYHATPGGLPDEGIRALALADSVTGDLWVGTFRGGLARLDVATGRWTVWNTATSPLPADQVRALAPEPGGGVWVGTTTGLAHRTAAGAWATWTPFNSALISGNIAALVRNPVDSTVWAGTVNGGLVRLRRGAVRVFTIRASQLPDNTILSLALDSLRRPVFGTAAAGLARYLTDSTWAAYGPQTSANPAATIPAVAQDSAGRWWLGTEQVGVVGWERGRWRAFPYRSVAALPDSTVRALAIGAAGDLWLGLRSGGLARWRPGPLGVAGQASAQPLHLTPNPAPSGQPLRISGLKPGSFTAELFDARGACRYQSPLSSLKTEASLLLPVLPPGLYLLRLTRADGVVVRRVVVE